MSNNQLLVTIRGQEQEIRRLRFELQNRNSVNYEQKYKKALKSIEDIIKANKQIKDELDALRMMRQADIEQLTQVQREEFKKSFEAVLKEKNSLVISLQTLELENEKLKYTVSELENQVSLYKGERQTRQNQEDKESLFAQQQTDTLGLATNQNSPKIQAKDREISQLLKDKEAEFHRTLQNYEEHHANISRANKRLEDRISELQGKLVTTEKNWRNKLESKEMEVIDIKALTRQQFTDQISALRKQNSQLKISNNEIALKLQNLQKNPSQEPYQNFDWEADLVQQMIAVKANLQPLRYQISELQELNIYEKEQTIREKTNLRTHVLELEAQVERQKEIISNLEKKIMESHQQKLTLEDKSGNFKKLEEQNQLLHGKIIVMESREIALRNRTGEELQERMLQFENRIELLLSNKEGLRELKQVGIHQLLALKAYILQLDSKIKELISSNTYLTKKYKSYKQKYQNSLKEHKSFDMTINSLKMKILGYDKLVLKLQQQLEIAMRSNDSIYNQPVSTVTEETIQVYKRKFTMIKEKLDIQEKYKEQEIQTLRLNYQTRIMELTIKVDQIRSIKQTLELYRSKNQELQMLVTRKDSQLFESKMLSSSKAAVVDNDPMTSTRQTKDIINNLHLNLKDSDEKLFKLQTELRTKEQNYKRTILKLQRDINDLKQDHEREGTKKQLDKTITFEQQIKKYKIKISDLEHELHLLQISSKDEHNKTADDFEGKLRRLEVRIQEAQNQRQQQIFNKRRFEKQVVDLTKDKEELQRLVGELQSKVNYTKQLQRTIQDLKSRQSITFANSKTETKTSFVDYQLQSKDSIIRKLNNEIIQLKSTIGQYGQKDITIKSLKNQTFYLKKQIQELNNTINKYNNEIVFLKGNIDSNSKTFNSGLQNLMQEKDNMLTKVRKELSIKDVKIGQLEDQISSLQQNIRILRRDLNEINYLKQEMEGMQIALSDKQSYAQRLKNDLRNYDQEIQRLKQENTFIKQNYQRLSYEILEKEDQISRLGLQINTITLRSKDQFQSKFNQELLNKEKQYNKLNSEYLTLKSSIAMLEQDKAYHEQNFKKANNELFNIRSQLSQLQEENSTLSNQLYYKSQQISKLQFSIQNFESELAEYQQKNQELYRMKNELFTIRSQNSALQDEIYNKDANLNRILKEQSFIKQQYSQIEQQSILLKQANNRLNNELLSIRSGSQQTYSSLQQKDMIISKLNSDLTSLKNKYRELQEEVQQRQQEFTNISQQINQLKANITYLEDDIQQKTTQITRLANQKQILKAEIVRLTEQITDKNLELNRSKQQIFGIKMQISQSQYQNQFKFQQEINNYKNKINSLQHELDDKDLQLRRINIQLETSRYKPVTAPISNISEEEVQELRNQINNKQRELINMKFDLEDKQYQAQSSLNSINLLKSSLSQYQDNLQNTRNQLDKVLRQFSRKERILNDQITDLREQLERLQVSQKERPKSYSISYSEEQMYAIQQKLNQKQAQFNQIRSEFQNRQFYIENLQTKLKMQQKLIQQLQNQSHSDLSRYESQINEYIKRQKLFREQMSELQDNFRQKLSEAGTSHSQISNLDYNEVIKAHINEIDRLTDIIKNLDEEIYSFKLKLSSMINQQTRIEENLVTMVLLFSEVESLRDRIKSKQTEINEVRKSFIQMTVAGEIQPNKMSRIMGLARQNFGSEERLEVESNDRSSITTPKQKDLQSFPSQKLFTKEVEYNTSTPIFERIQQGFKQNIQIQANNNQQLGYNIQRFRAAPQQIRTQYIEFPQVQQQKFGQIPNSQRQYQQKHTLLQGQHNQEAIAHEIIVERHQQAALPQSQVAQQTTQVEQRSHIDSVSVNKDSQKDLSEARGSLIMQLQKESQVLQQSQHRGSITITMQNTTQQNVNQQNAAIPYYPSPPRVVNTTQPIYVQPQQTNIITMSQTQPQIRIIANGTTKQQKNISDLQRSSHQSHQVFQVGPQSAPFPSPQMIQQQIIQQQQMIPQQIVHQSGIMRTNQQRVIVGPPSQSPGSQRLY